MGPIDTATRQDERGGVALLSGGVIKAGQPVHRQACFPPVAIGQVKAPRIKPYLLRFHHLIFQNIPAPDSGLHPVFLRLSSELAPFPGEGQSPCSTTPLFGFPFKFRFRSPSGLIPSAARPVPRHAQGPPEYRGTRSQPPEKHKAPNVRARHAPDRSHPKARP